MQDCSHHLPNLRKETADVANGCKEGSTAGEAVSNIDRSEENYRRSLLGLHRALRQDALFFVESYRKGREELNANDQLMYRVFCHLYDHLENIDGVLIDILDRAPAYDFRNHKINGYRSLVKVTQSCLTHLTALVRYISVNKHSYLFRSSHYSKELESYVAVLGQLRDVLRYTRKLMNYSPKGQLMPSEKLLDTAVSDEIQMEMDMIDQECFYGRALGFQFCDSMKRPFEVVHVSLATYSHHFQQKASPYLKLAGSLVTSTKYIMSPELRAQKVVDVTLNCDIDFCKAFWTLSESDLLHNMAQLALPSCSVNHIFSIEPTDLQVTNLDGHVVTIVPPSAHIGHQKLQMRLMSNCYRQGQERLPHFPQQDLMASPPSDYLIIQCHGGGFVSQTSRTHEAYLRFWANELQVPILCIDYSLAPEAPFPRALEEVYYAYNWALSNKHHLGTTAKKIALVGDSAGGNLLFACMLKAIVDNVRLPDGLVAVYTPVYIQYIPSPSRTLSIMDTLLPVGILTTCLQGRSVACKLSSHSGTSPSIEIVVAYARDHLQPWKGCGEGSMGDAHISTTDGVCELPSKEGICPPAAAFELTSEEEDEEVQSILHSDTYAQLAVLDGEERLHHDSNVTAEDKLDWMNANNSKRLTHRRGTHLTHNRSESLPVTPRLPSVPPHRNDHIRHFAQSPLYKFAKIRIKQNPFLSPLHASDELLSKLPSTYLVACHLDPCLDDSVMFAKRLDSLGVDVHLDAVDEVPHGFLNFTLVSKECRLATDFCREQLRKALQLP